MCRERAGCRPAQVRPLPEAHGEVGFDEIFGVAFNLPAALNKRRETVSVRADVEGRAKACRIIFLEAVDNSRMHRERHVLSRRIVDRRHELEVEGERTTVSDDDADGKTDDETVVRSPFGFEFVPTINNSPRQDVTLTVHPGIVYGFKKNYTVGIRAAFDIGCRRSIWYCL